MYMLAAVMMSGMQVKHGFAALGRFAFRLSEGKLKFQPEGYGQGMPSVSMDFAIVNSAALKALLPVRGHQPACLSEAAPLR